MKHVISRQDLECRNPNWYVFEGCKQGASISLHLSDAIAPGEGPRLHRHPYEEVFVIHEGQATYTLGDTCWHISQVRQFGRGNAATNKCPCKRAHDHRMA